MESDNKLKLEVERTNEKYEFIVTDNFVEEFTTLLEGTIKPQLEGLHKEEFQLYNVLKSKGYLDDDVLNYINYDWGRDKLEIFISNNVPFSYYILEDTGLTTRIFGYTDVEGVVTHIGRLLVMLRELDKSFKGYGRLTDNVMNMLKGIPADIKGKSFEDYVCLTDSMVNVLNGISDDIKYSALKKYWG